MDAPISFPHLFLRSLNEVHRSSYTAHTLFHPVFILRILLFLGLDDFPASEPVHIIASIGATFLRQRTAQMREGSKHPRVDPSGTAPPTSSTGIAYLSSAHHSFGAMCIFVCSCYGCSY